MSKIKGVGVDEGARPLNDPVTVVVTPEGNEIDADDWSHANNMIGSGCSFKEGYPTYPGEEPSAEALADDDGAEDEAEKAREKPQGGGSRRPRSGQDSDDAGQSTPAQAPTSPQA